MADQSGVPQVDFGILGDLGNTYSQARQLTLADLGRKQAAEALGRGDAQGALSALVGSGDARTLAALGQYQQHANSVYGTPIYGTDEKGQTRIGSFDKSGRFRPIETPGFTPTPGIKVVDTPQGQYVIGNKSGAPLSSGMTPAPAGGGMQSGAPQQAPQTPGFYPKDYRNTEADKVLGRETGEKQAAMGKAKAALDTNMAGLDQFQLQANEVLHHPGLSRITGMTGMLPNVPGFPGADAQAKLDTLKAKTGFAALQAMREASKTGGALGQVSDFENKNLQNSMVELQNAQSEGQIKKALVKMIGQIDGMKDRMRQAYEQDYAGLSRPASNALPASGQPRPAGQPVSKSIGGKNYIQINGQWFEQ